MRFFMALLILVVLAGCTSSLQMQGREMAERGEYDRAIDLLYTDIKTNPQSQESWRELGIAYYKKGDFDRAEEALTQADHIKSDARSNLYLGLIYERRQDYAQAINAYRAALALKPSSTTRKMLDGHLGRLISQNVEREVQSALTNESSINADTIPVNTIAVVDFDNTYLPPELAPISKGLAELTALDLAKVSSLSVVERGKIDALLKELELTRGGYVDPAAAPRVGRLVGSSRIVTGSLVGLGENIIRLDGAIVSIRDSLTSSTSPTEGDIGKFFQVQKDFVFKVVDQLGVTLSADERSAIEEVPTESFLAFMAYCRGVDFRSRGMNSEAETEFLKAVQADGGFGDARRQKQEASRAAAGASESASFEQYEETVVAQIDAELRSIGLDSFQGYNLLDSGFLIDFEQYLDAPVRFDDRLLDIYTRYGTVIIRGIFDANF